MHVCLPTDRSSLHTCVYLTKQEEKVELFRDLEGGSTSLVAQMVKNLPAMQETLVWSLGWEDPLEKGKATHSSILAWRIIPWTEKPGECDWATNTFTFFFSKHMYQVSFLYLWMRGGSMETRMENIFFPWVFSPIWFTLRERRHSLVY